MTVIKLPPPQAKGEGAGRPLANMSLDEIRGVATTAHDPLRGRFLTEDDPRVPAILEKQRQHVLAMQQSAKGQSKKKSGLEPGHRVYHTRRNMYGVVLKHSLDGKKIAVVFPKGEIALVQIKNLDKV
jgi:hypothetical protein